MENGKKSNNNGTSSNKALESISMQLAALLEMNKKQQEETAVLKQELAKLKQEKVESEQVKKEAEENKPVAPVNLNNLKSDRMVEIVHLADRASGLTTNLAMADGRTLIFRRYGDTVKVRYFELQQLLSTYYDLFYKTRTFTLGNRDQDVAEAEHLPTFDEKCLTKDELRSLLALSPKQLEEVYTRVCDTHKQLILSTWQRGFFTNEDPEYRNLDKVNALNKVSGNKLRTVYDNIVDPISKG